jgi:pyruvate kinase
MMDRIIRRVQADPIYFTGLKAEVAMPEHTSSDAISVAARQVAETVGAAAILSYTTSGATALRAARERPNVPVLALTSNLQTARKLAIAWGLHCVHARDVTNFTDMVHRATRTAHREGFAEKGERIVITAGVPFGTPGATNVLRIAWVEG